MKRKRQKGRPVAAHHNLPLGDVLRYRKRRAGGTPLPSGFSFCALLLRAWPFFFSWLASGAVQSRGTELRRQLSAVLYSTGIRISDSRPRIHESGQIGLYHGHKRNSCPDRWTVLLFGTRISLEVAIGVVTAFVGLFLLVKPDDPLHDQPWRCADSRMRRRVRFPRAARRSLREGARAPGLSR